MNKFKDIELFPWCYLPNWFHNIKEFYCFFSRRFQRGRYGISHYDCWNLDDYLLKVFKNGIVEFRKDTYSYPGNITEEEWDNILARMEELISIVQIDGIDCEEAKKYYDKNMHQWYTEVKKWDEYREECWEEFCDLMKEWFFHLWQ